jgi:hypothetical protein
VSLNQVWTGHPTNFGFQNQIFDNLFCTFESKFFQITFIKSYSLTAFQQQYQDGTQTPIYIFCKKLKEFLEKKKSIFINFSTTIGQKLKHYEINLVRCTLTCKEFPANDTKNATRGVTVEEISTWETNKLPSFIDNYPVFIHLRTTKIQ